MSPALLRALRYMRHYRLTAIAAIVAVLASSAADLAAPQLLRVVIDRGIAAGDLGLVARYSAWLVVLSVSGGTAAFVQGYLSARASHGAAFEMRDAIFGKLQELSFSYHDRAQTGQLITRVTSDVDLVREFVGGGLVQAVSAVLLLAGALVFLFTTNATLAIVALAVVPATIVVLLLFVRRLGPMFREYQVRLSALNTALQENVAGVRVVRAFAREEHEMGRFAERNSALLEQGLAVRRTVANAFPLLFNIGSIGVVVVTGVGSAQVISGRLTVGELVAFSSYLFLLLQPLFVIGFGAQSIARAGASAERLYEILDAPLDVTERRDATDLGAIEGRLEFRGVHLRYPGDTSEVLRGVSFVVEPGASVAIVGSTGSGKTSLVNLVPRFYDVTSGAVLVDDRDVRDVTLSSLRRTIGVVMQDSVLFSGTVRENIAYGRPDAGDEEIERAARAAEAHDFIARLPDGYSTRIGERGVRLSGGQRQRIAIARALLIDPRVLILDDSTSSVDARTEAALKSRLAQLMEGRTSLTIAQRLSTVRTADLILVMADGRVADQGTHEELMARSCLYAEIAASQLVGAEDLEIGDVCSAEDPDETGVV